jgi:hypothetical protein
VRTVRAVRGARGVRKVRSNERSFANRAGSR